MAPPWQPWTAIKAPMDSLDTDGRFSGYQRIAASFNPIIIINLKIHICVLGRKTSFICDSMFVFVVNSGNTLLYPSLCWNDAETGYRMVIPIYVAVFSLSSCHGHIWILVNYFAKKRMLYTLPTQRKKMLSKIYLNPLKLGGI